MLNIEYTVYMLSKQDFGRHLKILRTKERRTLTYVANAIGRSVSYLSKIEAGLLDPPSADTVYRIAKTLNHNTDVLLQYAGKAPNDLRDIITEKPSEARELLKPLSKKDEKPMLS